MNMGSALASAAVPSSVPSLRHLWQAPMFFLGLVTLLAGSGLHLWRTRACPCAGHDLAHARCLLERDHNPAEAATLLQRIIERSPPGKAAGEAYLLLGWAHAEMARGLNGDAALQSWREVREDLEKAENLGVAEEDCTRLAFRRAECAFHTGEEPGSVIERLGPIADEVDDRAEAYRILCACYLRLPRPDLDAALKANEQLRQLPLLSEDVLGPARLQGGEILFKLGRGREARKVLEKMSSDAAPELLAQARFLRARSLQEEEQWGEAAELWRMLLEDHRSPPGNTGFVLYHLGLCLRRLDQPGEAARIWQDCTQKSQGPEGDAAALWLGELRLNELDRENAVNAFGRAVRTLLSPDDWNNPYIDRARARQMFERGCLLYRQMRDFERSIQLARHYERLAAPGVGQMLRGQAAQDCGAERLAKATQSGASGTPEEQQARQLFRDAALAYEEAAEASTSSLEKADRLWSAAQARQLGLDHVRAIALLERYLQLNQRPENLSEAWYLVATSQQALQNELEMEKAYRECIKYETRFAHRARFQLAQLALTRGRIDDAEGILEQNLKLLRFDPDNEALEKTLLALGSIHYQRHNFKMVAFRLQEALSRFTTSPETFRARFQLAESYRQLAGQENQSYLLSAGMADETRRNFLEQHRIWLTKAAEQFQMLAQNPGNLTPVEATHAAFSAAECRFNLGQYDQALVVYELLVVRYKDRLERLKALGGTVRCHAALGQRDKLQQRLAEIRGSLANLDAATRQQWEEWLATASRGAGP
jgi:tetratricopeptide (TPR) repeat protein